MLLFDIDTWREVAETIGRNKRRSIATAFGVFWGIFMLIVLLSLSNGFRNGMRMATQSIAPTLVGYTPSSTSLPYDGLPSGRSWGFTEQDLMYIKQRVPEIDVVAWSQYYASGEKSLSYAGQRQRGTIQGVSEDYFRTFYVRLLAGRLFSSADHREKRKYCVIGAEVANSFFGSADAALGKVVKAKDSYFTVIGVVKPTSKMFNIGPFPEKTLYAPYSAAQPLMLSKEYVGFPLMTFREGVNKKEAKERIEMTIKTLKRISPSDKKAIIQIDIDDILGLFSGMNTGINILVWIVGIGTLLTGVVGISNILLVTVRERTQEIGVRRALGAKPHNILTQLLMEALSLTLIAGLLGIVAGVGVMSVVASNFQELSSAPFVNPIVDLDIVLLALAIVIVSGLVAGLIPAFKAIEVKAIEAIREE